VEKTLLNNLIARTLNIFLDFKVLKNPELLPESENRELFAYFNTIVKNTQDENTREKLIIMLSVCSQGWLGDFCSSFLNGRAGKQLVNLEKYILCLLREDSNILETKIKKIKELFDQTTDRKALQMAVHFYETYKKFCILTRSFQDTVSYTCLVNILDNLMIAFASLQMYDHLDSMVSLFFFFFSFCHVHSCTKIVSQISLLPITEKLRFIRNHHDNYMKNMGGKHVLSKSFVILEIIKSLLRDEFQKPPDEQSLIRCNMYVQFLLDFAGHDNLINRNLELVLMLPINMKAKSAYFYLVANSIRDKVILLDFPTGTSLINFRSQ
jgi:hypothetical protein